MKTCVLLNADLNRFISLLAHTDQFVVADSGFPVPRAVPVVDLRLVFGTPRFDQVLAAVLAEVTVEHAVVAAELADANAPNYATVLETEIPLERVTHNELKSLAGQARFAVRSAEDTPYSNILLTAGVAFL